MKTNLLYFGDNLEVLPTYIESETIDLVYLDPPFNSKRDYAITFKDRSTGLPSRAQTDAFVDTWTWTEDSIRVYKHLRHAHPMALAAAIEAFYTMLGPTPMMAYLLSMAQRLVQLHRVLKPTGTLWLHCDPTASHYLKLLLDALFGPGNFKNEIIWKRQSAHSDAKSKFSDVSDTILFYGKSKATPFVPQYGPHDPAYIAAFYRFDDKDGRGAYRLDNMASPNPRPNLMYEWHGFGYPQKGWRYSKETMQRLHEEGRINYPKRADGSHDLTKRPALKRYLKAQEGSIITNVWTDIPPVQSQGESLGYPTQKPLSLLRRILAAASSPGDVVLDPYCGCGTALAAAHEMDRQWIGIDVAPVAMRVIETRMKQSYSDLEKRGIDIVGLPTDLEGARLLFERDRFKFQDWACYFLLGARSLTKRGADKGIDGWLPFYDVDESEHRAVVQIKGGQNIGVGDVRDFCHVVTREKATLGFFVCLSDAKKSMADEALSLGLWKGASSAIYPRVQVLSVRDLLDGKVRPRLPSQEKVSVIGGKAGRRQKRGEQRLLFEDAP